MGSASIKLTSLKYDKSGGTAVLKSSGAQALVNSAAARMAANCNSIAQPVHGVQGSYTSEPKSLTHTAGAVIKSADVYAAIDNQRHNTLKKGCNS